MRPIKAARQPIDTATGCYTHPMHVLRARIETHLAGFSRIALETGKRRRAAVAIVLTPTEKGPAYLLTRRALHMRRGAGNYALPGGNLEPSEDAVDAARRETAEELGVVLGGPGP